LRKGFIGFTAYKGFATFQKTLTYYLWGFRSKRFFAGFHRHTFAHYIGRGVWPKLLRCNNFWPLPWIDLDFLVYIV